jgi:hypothetical protein
MGAVPLKGRGKGTGKEELEGGTIGWMRARRVMQFDFERGKGTGKRAAGRADGKILGDKQGNERLGFRYNGLVGLEILPRTGLKFSRVSSAHSRAMDL